MLMSPLLLDLRAGKLFFLSAPCSSGLRKIHSSKHHADQTFSSSGLLVLSPPASFLLFLSSSLPVLQDHSKMHASDVGNHPWHPTSDEHIVSNLFISLPFLSAWCSGNKKKNAFCPLFIHPCCRIVCAWICFMLSEHELLLLSLING